MKARRFTLLVVISLAAGLHLLLWLPLPLIVQTAAALLLTGLLPGALLVEWLVGCSEAPPDRWERALYSVAAGYGVITLVMLAVSYWPGGVARWPVLGVFDLLLVILLGLVWGATPPQPEPKVGGSQDRVFNLPSPGRFARRGAGGGVAILLLIAAYLRFANLGYAEFQGDEGRAVLRAAAVIQGYENVLFLHRKGPVEILLPALVYALTGHITEATARLPFALASLAGVAAIFVLGWRLFNPIAGWVAALFLALDGYFIGFARIVQYQSIVVLMSLLIVLILCRLVQRPAGLQRYLVLAAFFLATGMLAHYEAALVVVPGLYLLWKIWQQHKPPHFIGSLVMGAVVAGAAAGLFYVPYLLNPAFQNTYAYLADERIGGHFPYNNLADFFLRTTLYDTTYAVLLLIGLAVIALLRVYWATGASPWRWLLSGIALLGLALTFAKPDWLTIGATDYTFAFFLALFAIIWLPKQRSRSGEALISVQPTTPSLPRGAGALFGRGWGERALWLWFGALLLLSLFFTAKPRTHVYVFFMPWMLIAGATVAAVGQILCTRWGTRRVGVLGGLAAILIVGVFGSYAYWYFVYNQVEIYRTWSVNHPAGFWTVYAQPDDRSLFGFPLRNGWKTVGMLYADGVLTGAYETNDVDDWVTDWYVPGGERCLRDQRYFILADSLEQKSQARKLELLKKLSQDYHLFGTVLVNQQPRLQIYQRGSPVSAPQTFDSAAYAQRFDQALSGPLLALATPVIEPAPAHLVHLRFGDSIWLEGYTVDRAQLQPGSMLNLTLYWRTTQPIKQKLTVSNQVRMVDNLQISAGQLTGQPGCEVLPTDDWPVGDLIADYYRIPIVPAASPGEYQLMTNLMDPKQGKQLAVYQVDNKGISSTVTLMRVQVVAKQ